MVENSLSKLIPLPKKGESRKIETAPLSGMRPKEMRRRILAASFLICVLFPSFLSSLYYTFIASDRYVSGAGFTVRGMDAGGGNDFIGAVTGLASTGSTTSDSYILLNYLKSRDIVERLEKDFQFRTSYSAKNIDFFSRLNPQLDIEHVVEYWSNHIRTTFDTTSGIITFEVDAFTPKAAQQVAENILLYSRELVNELSSRAREDTLAYAENEVGRSELRLRLALEALRNFREKEKSIDPTGSARIQLELIGTLEKKLAEIRARIAALENSVASDAPSIRNLIRQAEALEQQIMTQRSDMGANENRNHGTALTGQLATYETLEVERNFAQQFYASALSSLEKARVEANRQQRYLAAYTTPSLPQYPLYPRRILNIFMIFSILTIVWCIGVLITYAVRDHIS